MIRPLRIRTGGRELDLSGLRAALAGSRGRLELEIGFGKGRYLMARAASDRDTTFVGIEAAPEYWALGTARVERRGLGNVVTLCGDALYVLSACLEPAIADACHVYFPDPWPKTRHRRRRLLDAATVDLVLGALRPGGRLYFATDHAEYGVAARAVLESYPGVAVEEVAGPWPGGVRTHYETKYQREGRSILRLVAERLAPGGAAPLHPAGERDVVAAAVERAVAADAATPTVE